MKMRWDKRAESISFETTIFIILNVVFVVLILIFVNSSGKGAFIYEEMYAKQIALLIDNAEPGMTLGLDIAKAVELAEENGVAREKTIVINKEEGRVEVSLSEKGGHSFEYFSDYDVDLSFTGDHLFMKIKEAENVE